MSELAELFGVFVSSPEWFRAVLAVLLFGYALAMPLRPPFFRGIVAVPIVLLLRDTLLFFLGDPGILLSSELLIIGLYVGWLSAYRRKVYGFVYLGLSAAAAAGFVLVRMFWTEPLWFRFLHIVLLVSSFLFLVYQLFTISHKSAPGGEFVERIRGSLISYYSFAVAIFAFFPYRWTAMQAVLIPLTYLVHLYIYYEYRVEATNRSSISFDFMRKYLNSTFEFMKTINKALSERTAVQQVLEFAVESVVETTAADGGAVLLINPDTNRLEVKSLKGYYPPPYEVPEITKKKVGKIQVYFKSTDIPVGETLLGEVATSLEPVYIPRAEDDPRLANQNRDEYSYVSSLIILPLIASERVFGVLSVAKRHPGHMFSQQDYERCSVFADYTALSMEALYNYTELIEKKEIEREVGIAADIQKWFLPAELPKIDGLDVAAASYPARGVSGDYYDVLPIPQKKGEGNGKAAVLICDVAGKGVPASLVMVMIRTIVHLIAGAGRSAGQIAGLVNRGVAGNVSIERFATFSYLMCDPVSGAVEYANAGHHPLLLYRAAGDEFEKVDADGLPIGLDKKSSYSQVEVQLEPGDIALLYTDGIVEAMNAADEQFGEERVREVLRGNGTSAASAEEIMRKLYDELENFVDGAPQHDDETLIVMKKM